MCTACKCTYITRKHTNVHTTHSYSTPLESCTHAHLIGVSRIGASLQHRAHTGRESEACTKKQEPVLVVIRDVAVLRVLHEGCLHLVVAGMLNSHFALLREEGRQGVRGECLSMPNLSRAHPVCIATVVHACLLAGVHVHVCACMCMCVRAYTYTHAVGKSEHK